MSNFDNKFPYNLIETRTYTNPDDDSTVDFVYIPKFFIKTSQDENGLIKRYVSNVHLPVFRCHPAFMHLGHEVSGILVQADPSNNQSLNYISAQSNAYNSYQWIPNTVNWSLQSIYDYSAILLLMMIEYGTSEVQGAIDWTYATDPAWRGIQKLVNAGAHYSTGQWLKGLQTKSSKVYIHDNIGNENLVELPITPMNGYPVTLCDEVGEGYNLQDLFFGKTFDSNNFTYNGAQQTVNTTNTWYYGCVVGGQAYGFRCVNQSNVTKSWRSVLQVN